MSELTDFLQSGFDSASTTIGTKPFIIDGGTSINVVKAEEQHEREWEQQGYDSEATLTIVASTVDFDASYILEVIDYQGKPCTVGGNDWKIGMISKGDHFTTINLVSLFESA